MKITLTALSLALIICSCSIIKNPQSHNFQRVKYHAHLKKSKSKEEGIAKTIRSFDTQTKAQDIESNLDEESNKMRSLSLTAQQEIKSAPSKIETNQPDIVYMDKVNEILNDASSIQINQINQPIQVQHSWWDDDLEDWPWGEIALGVITVLLIAILVVLLIDLIGVVVGSLFGLILLIALAYLLYYYWV